MIMAKRNNKITKSFQISSKIHVKQFFFYKKIQESKQGKIMKKKVKSKSKNEYEEKPIK